MQLSNTHSAKCFRPILWRSYPSSALARSMDQPTDTICKSFLSQLLPFAFVTYVINRGNALVLDSMDRLVVYNMREGCAFHNLPSMVRTTDASYTNNRNDGNPYCNQGIASLANATYVASVSKHGVIHILRSRDGSRAGSLKISGAMIRKSG